ncbi:TIGR03086 family protein [Mycobacterium sp. CBMA271]|uniref:TIGR03086 family metal-binding protein n=1 Tax=unclassified Mycobacteroides TaxID=2618759 RepID=UPI0012DBFD05|nr:MULTISPECIES: TIGR03086 family metal-binding protein [unclassified Mycobacteroides]MUM20923.1 TIGR03086 family protein [Mycobacteroides sp. CBMA 271]
MGSAEDFTRASEAVEKLVAGIRPEQWDAPTPCTEWNLRQLVEHLAEVNYALAERFGGLGGGAENDPAVAYRASAQSLSDALALPGVLEQTYPGPFANTTGDRQLQIRMADLITHGWDLAQVTGLSADLPGDLIENALAFVERLAGAFARSGKFGTPQPAPADASALDRLAALSGRVV